MLSKAFCAPEGSWIQIDNQIVMRVFLYRGRNRGRNTGLNCPPKLFFRECRGRFLPLGNRYAARIFARESWVFINSWFGQSRKGGSCGSSGRVGGSPGPFFCEVLNNSSSVRYRRKPRTQRNYNFLFNLSYSIPTLHANCTLTVKMYHE